MPRVMRISVQQKYRKSNKISVNSQIPKERFGNNRSALFYAFQNMEKRLRVSLLLFSLDMANSLIFLFVFGDTAKFQQPAIQALLLLICTTMISHISYPPEAKEIAFDRKQTLLLLVIPAMSVIILSVLMLGEPPKLFAILISACMLIINISVFYL